MKPTTATPNSIFAEFAATARFALHERQARYRAVLQRLLVKARSLCSSEVGEFEAELNALERAPWKFDAPKSDCFEVRRLRAAYERDISAIFRHLPVDVKAVALGENITKGAFSEITLQDLVAA